MVPKGVYLSKLVILVLSILVGANSVSVSLSPTDNLAAELAAGSRSLLLSAGSYVNGVTDIIITDTISISCVSRNCTLDAQGTGRFFVVESGGQLILVNVTLMNGDKSMGNQTPLETWGGAIVVTKNGTLNATGCTFSSNRAFRGGAFGSVSMSTAFFDTCSFLRNTVIGAYDPDSGVTVPGRGGAFFSEGSPVFLGCTFSENRAHSSVVDGTFGAAGGAGVLFSENIENPIFERCLFINNSAEASSNLGATGGAIYVQASNPSFTECLFSSNSASAPSFGSGGVGGAVAVLSLESAPASVEFNRCSFITNVARAPTTGQRAQGGAIMSQTSQVRIDSSIFIGNAAGDFLLSAGGLGGAINFIEIISPLTLTNCTFENNYVSGTPVCFGGAVYIVQSQATLSLVRSSFINNRINCASDSGGAAFIAQKGSSVSCSDCVFNQNTVSGGLGGAVYVANTSIVTLNGTGCSLEDNIGSAFYSLPLVADPRADIGLQAYTEPDGELHISPSCLLSVDCPVLTDCTACVRLNSSCGWGLAGCAPLTHDSYVESSESTCCPLGCSGSQGVCVVNSYCSCSFLFQGSGCSSLSVPFIFIIAGSAILITVSVALGVNFQSKRILSRKHVRDQVRILDTLQKKISQVNMDIPESAKVNPEDLILGSKIGEGGMGNVYLGTWRGCPVAIKQLKGGVETQYDEATIAALRCEAKMMSDLRHPNIAMFMGASFLQGHICIVTEYFKLGSLNDILHNRDIELDWSLKKKIAVGAARGIAFLHSNRPVLLHRDLKSHNILMSDNFEAKITDFGLSKLQRRADYEEDSYGTVYSWLGSDISSFSKSSKSSISQKHSTFSDKISRWKKKKQKPTKDTSSESLLESSSYDGTSDEESVAADKVKETIRMSMSGSMTSNVGTAAWLAPEVISFGNDRVQYTCAADVYSFGVVLWEIATRRRPFEQYRFSSQVLRAVLAGERLEIPSDIPEDWASVIRNCQREAAERPTMSTILENLQNLQPLERQSGTNITQ